MSQSHDTTAWQDDPLWYKDAIIYQTHVKAFFDSNDDGMGDFRGLTRKLDYIQSLGVNTVWLLPFYPSPFRDDGYDIADYSNIHPEYGTRQDFRNFVREAHRRGLKVITELVINHTSDQHPWFQAARRAPKGSPKRDFYVWNDDDKKFPETRIIFTDTETANWAWDPVAQQYYWHRFFSHQPDLNHNNPHVVKAVTRIMKFWMDQGVDGLRLDAIPYLCVKEGTANENLPETHAVLKQMRAALDERYDNRMFLAEANQWPEDVRDYFGNGDECHMAYHFPVMPRMYMAIAMEDRHPIIDIMAQTPEIPENCQWAVFLRNHDELTLEMVTDKERDYMYSTYAADPRMRVNVGIRRRLAPLMDNDIDRLKLMNVMLLSMPGTPIIYYGDEIGMGDNIYLGDRNGVRTPMQWSPDRNAGFSRTDPQRLYLPPIMDPIYGFEAVNVEAQNRNPSSLLNWMRRMISVRKAHKSFGRGSLEFIRPGNRKILAYLREYEDESILVVINLARSSQPVELDLSRFKGRVPVEMRDRTHFPPIGDLPYFLTLPPHGFYWLQLTQEEAPSWHEDHLVPEEMSVLVLMDEWQGFFPERFDGNQRTRSEKLIRQLEKDVLPPYLKMQRWFAAKGETVERVALMAREIWQEGERSWLIARIEVYLSGDRQQVYSLPLSVAWERDGEERIKNLWPYTLCKVRQHSRVGVLYDAFGDEDFSRAMVKAMGAGREIPLADGKLVFSATSAFPQVFDTDLDELTVKRSGAEGSNTAMVLGDKAFLKGYRRLQPGVNPELELGRYLTDVSPLENIVPLVGAVEYRTGEGEVMTLGLLQAFVRNQGDAWAYTLDSLHRFLAENQGRLISEVLDEAGQLHGVYLMQMDTLGRRTGELHAALAKSTGMADFEPEPVKPNDVGAWTEQLRIEVIQTLDQLAAGRERLPESLQSRVGQLLAMRNMVLDHVAGLLPPDLQAFKTRYHGDYHLGQVLLVKNDFVIIDFEGEPARPLNERRIKHSPLKDVAGILRSFNYAGYASLYAVTEERPEELHAMEPLVQDWQRRVSDAFMVGYREAVAGTPAYPEDSEAARRLTEFFILEKAFYELRYELNNRPTWVGIPLGGLLELLIHQGA